MPVDMEGEGSEELLCVIFDLDACCLLEMDMRDVSRGWKSGTLVVIS
jgi:hypothetical protein